MSRPSRGAWLTALKFALGLGILALIAAQLELKDRVELASGAALRGSDLSLADAVITVQPAEGGVRSYRLDEALPALESDGKGWRYRPSGQRAAVALLGPPVRSGVVTLQLEAESSAAAEDSGQTPKQERIPLESVAYRLSDKPTEGEWRAARPAIDEGLVTIFGRLDLATYALAMLFLALMNLAAIIRWWLLLRTQGLPTGFWEAFRFTFIGQFFNNVVPGATGGDVVKAGLVAHAHRERMAEAVTTVIVDRVLGLLVLAGIGVAASLAAFERYQAIAAWVALVLGAALAVGGIALSRRARRALGLSALARRLPVQGLMTRLDGALQSYRKHPGTLLLCVALSVFAHGCTLFAIALMGLDLGLDEANGLEAPAMLTYFVTLPMVLIVSALPLMPGGWGVGEAAYAFFFAAVGIRNLSLSVGLSVLSRVSFLLFSLLGGALMLFGRRETRETIEQVRSEEGDAPPEGIGE